VPVAATARTVAKESPPPFPARSKHPCNMSLACKPLPFTSEHISFCPTGL
jgi:hypothetical protein